MKAPVNQRIKIILVLPSEKRVKGRNLANVAIVDFVETAGLDDGHRSRFGQPGCDGQAGVAAA